MKETKLNSEKSILGVKLATEFIPGLRFNVEWSIRLKNSPKVMPPFWIIWNLTGSHYCDTTFSFVIQALDLINCNGKLWDDLYQYSLFSEKVWKELVKASLRKLNFCVYHKNVSLGSWQGTSCNTCLWYRP